MTGTSEFLIGHGLTVIFVVVFAEQMGLPIPAIPWLLAAGALSASGQFNLFVGVGFTVVACVLADTFWFYLGRWRGTQVLGWLCRISIEPDSCVRRTQNLFTRYGLGGVLFAKFVPGLGGVVRPLAGMAGISASRFIFVDALGSFLYGLCGLGLGNLFNQQIEQIGAAISHLGGHALTLLVWLAVIYIAYKYWQRRRLLQKLKMARITVTELRQKLEAGEKLIILDLRSITELTLDPAMIQGAIHVEAEKLIRQNDLPKDRDIIIYCSCPNEVSSARLALSLQRKGFVRTRPLLGGIEAWRKLEYPVAVWTSVGAAAPDQSVVHKAN